MLVRCLNLFAVSILGTSLLATTLSAAPITGGTGPGGIGTTNGASSLNTWLRADLGITTANTLNKVSGWADQSGKNFHGTQTILGVQPDFVSGVSSGYHNRPIVRVDGNQYLKLAITHAPSNYTFFFAIDPANTQVSSTLSYLFDNDVQRMIPAFYGSDTRPGFFDAAGVWRVTTTAVAPLVTPQLLSYTFDSSAGGSIVRNGTNLPMVNNTYTPQSLGLSGGGAGLPRWVAPNFAGDYAEVAIFDTALTSSQRTIVENYMSGRYGLSIANDRYSGDTSHGYEEDIFGVGSTGTSAAWTNSGSNGLGIEATSVDANDWLLAGHDVPTNSIVGFESPQGYEGSRWDRVWFVDKTGSLDATLAFDFEDAGLTLPTPGSTFHLLYSADSNFTDGWQSLAQTSSISNGTVAFSLANGALLDGFYTLGLNIHVPEPNSMVLLLGFLGYGILRRRKSLSMARTGSRLNPPRSSTITPPKNLKVSIMLIRFASFAIQFTNNLVLRTNFLHRKTLYGLLGILVSFIGATNAQATILDMRNLVLANPNLTNFYTFEGANVTQRQADKKGSVNLVTNTAGTGNAGSIAYITGYDGVSVAMRPHYIDVSNGAGLQTASGIALPGSGFTVEMLIAPGATVASDPGYAIAGPLFPNRAYPLFQREGDLKVAAGGLAFTDGNALRDVSSTYSNDNWYYVAVTMQNSGADTLVNAYVANLTAGETSLTQTLSNSLINGNYATTANVLGIGKFPSSTQPLNGMMDEVAIYNSVLNAATLTSHFEALLPPPAPEPSSLLLLSLGMLGLVRQSRKRHTSPATPA